MSKSSLKHLNSTCRVCAKYASTKRSPRLFDKSNLKLIENIETITGLRLESFACLPDLICECCSMELSAAIKFRERCIGAQRSLLTGLTADQQKGISSFYKAAIMGTDLEGEEEDDDKKAQPPEHGETEESYRHDDIEPKEEEDEEEMETKIEYDNDFYDLAENNVVEEDEASLIEEAEYESLMADEENEDQMHQVQEMMDESGELITGDGNDGYVYDSDDEVAVLDNVLDDEYEHENIVVKKSSLPPKPKARSDDPRRRGTGGMYICEQCGNHIKGRMAFELHCRRHRGDKQYGCELCNSRFCTTSELKRHMRKHTGERPFACQYCGRCFTDYTTRVKHERTHTNERPYVCGTCGKAFTTGYILKNHMLIHSGERAYRCELCDKSFMLPTHLSTHFRSGVHKRHMEKAGITQEREQKKEHKLEEVEEDSLNI
ncbi:transcription factor Ouib [Drosophila guanche]|nr:transcription factor Ouib [Drosophila guanche]SPP84041.1 blast:GDNF-inducible zinc finger protein 1 [Drosophila guanche]